MAREPAAIIASRAIITADIITPNVEVRDT
jgi:hypothetical protein